MVAQLSWQMHVIWGETLVRSKWQQQLAQEKGEQQTFLDMSVIQAYLPTPTLVEMQRHSGARKLAET